jgi:hypothetical protein
LLLAIRPFALLGAYVRQQAWRVEVDQKVRIAALLWGMDIVIGRGAVGFQAMRLFQVRNILLLENLM